MPQESAISQQMRILANSTVVGFGEEKFDYSETSVQRLEDLIEEHDQLGLNPEDDIAPNARYWGAYLGEVFRRNIGGEWIHYKNDQFEADGIKFNDVVVFPYGKVLKRIFKGKAHNLVAFYKVFKGQMLEGKKSPSPVPTKTITVTCPKCGGTFSAHKSLEGLKARCPKFGCA